MFIQIQETPNPNALKFVVPMVILEHGSITFRSDNCQESLLAMKLFEIPNITQVFFSKDFITITAVVEAWPEIKNYIISTITDHLLQQLPVLKVENSDKEFDELSKQIIEILETRVRPAVASDGGDVKFVKFEDGVVYLELTGACSGCPSAHATLKQGIEGMLKYYIPEVEEVQAVV